MGELNPGIIICSRSDSTRIPNKPWATIQGRYLISRLLDKLTNKKNFPRVCVAVPPKDSALYIERLSRDFPDLAFYSGCESNPLRRMKEAADHFKFDPIIRICHDKVFIDTYAIRECLSIYEKKDLDYIYSSNLIDGSGFEIFSKKALDDAASAFSHQNVEHVSYAIKSVTKKTLNYDPPVSHFNRYLPDVRFLIDFEEDLDFIRAVYDFAWSKDPNLEEACEIVEKNPFLKDINRLPELTVYTCAYNEEDYIEWAIESVVSQTIFHKVEFIVIDDHSSDNTYKKVISSKHFKKIKLKRNESNLGLSSSSNIALNMARGKYILRLDADDALLFPFTLEKMLTKAKTQGFEALYPAYIDHGSKAYRDGSHAHHVGGCLFLTKSIRNIQFTEKLRGWEGLDLFNRAKDHIKIGYYDEHPVFFYRDRPNSMSKTNLEYRKKIKDELDSGLVGKQLSFSDWAKDRDLSVGKVFL